MSLGAPGRCAGAVARVDPVVHSAESTLPEGCHYGAESLALASSLSVSWSGPCAASPRGDLPASGNDRTAPSRPLANCTGRRLPPRSSSAVGVASETRGRAASRACGARGLHPLLDGHTRDALSLLAGERRAIIRLFGQPKFGASPELADKNEMYMYGANKTLLPVGERPNSSLRFAPVPPFRRSLYVRALKPFRGLKLSRRVRLHRSGPFPRVATSREYQVFAWRVLSQAGSTFVPDEEYEELVPNAV